LKANVYIDGFNLYYGIKKWPECKWLDLEALAERLFRELSLIRQYAAMLPAVT